MRKHGGWSTLGYACRSRGRKTDLFCTVSEGRARARQLKPCIQRNSLAVQRTPPPAPLCPALPSHMEPRDSAWEGFSQSGSALDPVVGGSTLGLCTSPPAGQACSWTSTGRSPGSSEATSSWCRWATTSVMTSPRSGTPSSSTTSGSLTSSTASLTSTCRSEGCWAGGPGASAVLQPSPSHEVLCSPLRHQRRALFPTCEQGSVSRFFPSFCEVQRVG